mmetsp:Transcript_6184/g.8787  ORF Transcript_6184/g.8787 Transcript_6184/m.8787 type:complete len:146 (+) Transcript_6184:343-780(+)
MPSYNLRPRDKNKAQAAKENAANDRAEPRQPRKAPSTTKKTTGTKKSGNTKAKKSGNANSTRTSNRAGGEDPQAADSSLAITLEDLKTLDAECLKRKVQSIYAHLGLQNIHDELGGAGRGGSELFCGCRGGGFSYSDEIHSTRIC